MRKYGIKMKEKGMYSSKMQFKIQLKNNYTIKY
jgi:hypothetical protein